MDRLSQLTRARGLLLLGLALGLRWGAATFLVPQAMVPADEDDYGRGGRLGIMTGSVPALDGVTEAAASAVHSTSSAIADTVEELPRLGHLPVARISPSA